MEWIVKTKAYTCDRAEMGITLPGTTLHADLDSHTSTTWCRIGALAFGIGTSEVEHVLASQTVWMKQPLPMEILMQGLVPIFWCMLPSFDILKGGLIWCHKSCARPCLN